MTQAQQTTPHPEFHSHSLDERLSAIGPAALPAADDLEEMLEQAATCESATSSDAGVRALIELAQHVRSPQAMDFIPHLRDRLGKPEVTLTGNEIRLLLKLALHVKRRKRKLHVPHMVRDAAAHAQNTTVVSVSPARKTPE